MGRQTWKHVNQTRPLRGHGQTEIGARLEARYPPDRIRPRYMTRVADPVMLRKDALVAFALGIALLVITAALAVTASRATGGLLRASGTIVRIVQDSDAMRAYRPIVAYLASDGRRREVAGDTASAVPAYDIGENVDVLVDPAHPNRPALIDDFAQRWSPVAVPALLAVVSLAIGCVLYVDERRNRRPGAPFSASARDAARRRWNIAIVLIPLALGTAFMAGAGAAGLRQWQAARHYAHSTGHVVEIAEPAGASRNRASLDSVSVAFTTDSGRAVTFEQSSGSPHPRLYEGERVNVLYDPVAPERAIIDQFWDRWSVTAILFAIGAPLFVAGLVAAGALWPEPRLHELVE
ncbi:hypothetical protein WI93_24290 [Burkholderia vietnamiensis]|uniref:DUF3592 domain-containing protein n=1 Tax=Burkholderia vietnamiensis TaxID=60552 RepID=UPI000755B420|nr:DUF3592 domain-containing protein [Burkholderia vietnamiensis]KVE33469.1 hypothetical protein WI93_24290 [Burkholderia vietnamiensis]